MDIATLAGTLTRLGATALATVLGGPAAGAAIGALASALGSDPTPEGVAEAIEANPETAAVAVAMVEAKQGAALAELNARLADVQDARSTTVKLVQAGSSIAWGAPVVSVIIVIAFAAVLLALFFKALPDNQVALLMIGALVSEFRGVTSYWLGSSRGSQEKDATIRAMSQNPSSQIGTAIGGVIGGAVKKAIRR
ncbi:MAG: hypothetical protein ACKVON_08120 [Beijerinckiaceae bacterium]